MSEPETAPPTAIEEQLLRCTCREPMTRAETATHPDNSVHLEVYQCRGTCGRKAVLIWELTGRPLDPARKTWVETEVARRGAFFPSDYR